MKTIKTGLINFNPSAETIALAKRINELKKENTYDEIALKLKYTRAYVIALNNYYRKLMGEK